MEWRLTFGDKDYFFFLNYQFLVHSQEVMKMVFRFEDMMTLIDKKGKSTLSFLFN